MRDLYLRMQKSFNDVLKAQGVSLAQLKFLLFIERSGSVRSIDICEGFSFAPRTVTEAIDALERDGLVQRDPDPNDRRAKRISLTEAGKGVIRDADPYRQALTAQIFEVLTEADQAEMLRLLTILNDRLIALGGPSPDGDGDSDSGPASDPSAQ
ncbi:MarR family transcriptional regulator [Sphingobium aquiterrae]|uniref:MarR family winged helix-turn-helix transcriptional regulator n=1 Tax=Sphingobium aquiterrae TaxID=2038656 RepID=UPI00301B2216